MGLWRLFYVLKRGKQCFEIFEVLFWWVPWSLNHEADSPAICGKSAAEWSMSWIPPLGLWSLLLVLFFFPLWFEDVSSSTLHFSFMGFVLHEEKRGKKKEDTQALGLTCDMLWTKLLKKICDFLEWLYGICGGLWVSINYWAFKDFWNIGWQSKWARNEYASTSHRPKIEHPKCKPLKGEVLYNCSSCSLFQLERIWDWKLKL